MHPFFFSPGTGNKLVNIVILADVCKVSVRFAVRMCRLERLRMATGSETCLF